MTDDLEFYLQDMECSEFKRLGEAAFNWLFQKARSDRQILSARSICYMLGSDIEDLRNTVISRLNQNDKIRARVVQHGDDEFSIVKIQYNNTDVHETQPCVLPSAKQPKVPERSGN
jgi:hypothetical protein